jgi:hypothetical protein
LFLARRAADEGILTCSLSTGRAPPIIYGSTVTDHATMIDERPDQLLGECDPATTMPTSSAPPVTWAWPGYFPRARAGLGVAGAAAQVAPGLQAHAPGPDSRTFFGLT